jgi:hypothetical protein
MPEVKKEARRAHSRHGRHESATAAEYENEAADLSGQAGVTARGSATVTGPAVVAAARRTEQFMDSHEDRVRFRVWVDAQLVNEVWLDARDTAALHQVEQVWQRHQDAVGKAEADGTPWVIEIYDSSLPEDQALRFGTDTSVIKGPTRDLSALLRRLRATPVSRT